MTLWKGKKTKRQLWQCNFSYFWEWTRNEFQVGLCQCHDTEGRLAQRLVINSNGFQEAGVEKAVLV